MQVIIDGCGRVGAQLAQFLAYEGHNVVVIDKDADSFNRLGGTFNGITRQGVAFDEELLKEAGIESADILAAVTNYDNTNLMTAEIARNIFRVPTVVARLYNPDKSETFHKLGIEYVCGTTMLAASIKKKLLQNDFILHYRDPEPGIEIIELVVGVKLQGRAIRDLQNLQDLKLLAIFRNTEKMDWSADTTLEAEDRLVLALKEGAGDVLSRLAGGLSAGEPDAADRQAGQENGPPRELRAVIAGCGRVGAQLAELLSMEGHRVSVIDRDSRSFQRLPDTFKGDAISGYAFDEETLNRAGIDEADVFAAVTNYDNANLMTAEVVKHIFGVPKVIARLYNPDKEETFEALGFDYVCGTELVAREILDKIMKSEVKIVSDCLNNTHAILKFSCPHRLAGKKAGWCEENLRLRIGSVRRNGVVYFLKGDERLQADDEIIALMPKRRLPKLERYLKVRTRNGRR